MNAIAYRHPEREYDHDLSSFRQEDFDLVERRLDGDSYVFKLAYERLV